MAGRVNGVVAHHGKMNVAKTLNRLNWTWAYRENTMASSKQHGRKFYILDTSRKAGCMCVRVTGGL